MTWASLGNSVGTADKVSAASTQVFITANAASVVVLIIAKDNVSTTDANTSEVTGVTDPRGNTWTKAREFCNGQGAAAAGAVVSVWVSQLVTALSPSDTVTVNFSSAITAKATTLWNFSVSAGSTVSVAGTPQDLANDAADPGSQTISGLASGEYLFIRAVAMEDNGTAFTPTAGHTTIPGSATSGAAGATNIGAFGEFRILTATSDTSNPTVASADSASVFFALLETAGDTIAAQGSM